MTPNETFLLAMRDAALAANHVWPEYAACEAAVETAEPPKDGDPPQSNYGKSQLFLRANNVFGNKVPAGSDFQSINMQTNEVINGVEIMVPAQWIMFPTITAAFQYRMATLKRLSMYALGLKATTGEEFVRLISAMWIQNAGPADNKTIFAFTSGTYRFVRGLWSTGPYRAYMVKEIHDEHAALFTANPPAPPAAQLPTVGVA